MARETYNLVVRKDLAEAFEKWALTYPGKKGEKMDGALIAIMALSHLSPHLIADLMRPGLVISQAAELIKQTIVDLQVQGFLASLSDGEKAKVLADAKRYKDKPSRKK